MHNIKRVSSLFQWFFTLLLIAVPILQAVGWSFAPDPVRIIDSIISIDVIPRAYSASGWHGHDQSPILHTLSAGEKWMGFGISMIPQAVNMLVLYFLVRLFQLYARAEIFSLNNVRYIRYIAYALLAGQLINPFYEGVMGFVLTWHNPPGHRYAAVTLDQTNFAILLTALLIILISWVMAEGCKLREEQQLTI